MKNQSRWKGRVDQYGRECSVCECYKPWADYSPSASSRTGYLSACKLCRNARYVPADPVANRSYQRRRHLANKFGITPEQYAWLSEQQDGLCALCGDPDVGTRRVAHNGVVRVAMWLAIDHDHACSNHLPNKACKSCIRGLLCDNCNRTLGFAERKPRVAARFSDYLERRPLL